MPYDYKLQFRCNIEEANAFQHACQDNREDMSAVLRTFMSNYTQMTKERDNHVTRKQDR